MKKWLLFSFIALSLSIACVAQLPAIENGALVIEEPVSFKPGTAILQDDALVPLQKVKAFLDAKTYISMMRVEGHTNNSGVESNNQTLSEKRALAVCKWLINNGIDCKRLIAVGFGSNKPAFSNDTPEGKAGNRRIVFKMAALKGMAIGGMPIDGGGQVAGDVCN